jgi:Zn-dependent peptidase ImmA (M78 family)
MFTLAHELAHVWLGKTGVSDVGPITAPSNKIEQWCNEVAAEILVPRDSIKKQYKKNDESGDEMSRLARFYKVSTLVILRRMFDAAFFTYKEFSSLYNDELERLLNIKKGSGGDYYRSQPARVSRRFARALILSTLEGQTLHRDAFQLLGVKKLATFRELGDRLGIM